MDTILRLAELFDPLNFKRKARQSIQNHRSNGRAVGRMNERTNGQANNIKEEEKKMTRRRTVDTELSQYHQVRAVVSLPPILQTQTRYERTFRLRDYCPWPFHFDYFRLPVADATTTAVLAPQQHPVPTRTLLLARSGTKMTPPRK